MSTPQHTPPPYSESPWLQELYMQAPVAIAIYVGEQFIIEFANPMMCELWGRKAEQVLHRPLFEALPEIAAQGYEEILADVLQTGEAFSGSELPATLEKDKQLKINYFNILYKPLRNKENQIIGIIQLATDVTSLVEARKQAEWQEEILKVALESGKMGTWYVDLLQQKAYHSLEHALILGYDGIQADWNHHKFLAHVLPEDLPLVEASYQRSLQSGLLEFEVRIKRLDKQVRWIQVKGRTTNNLKGQPISVSGIVMDVTKQKENSQREQQLALEVAAREAAEKQKEVLYALFDEAPALICTFHGPQLVFGLVNKNYQRLFPGRQLSGKPMLEAVPELTGQQIIGIIEKVYASGETFVGSEVPVQIDRTGTGKLEDAYFNISYQPLHDEAGKVNGIMLFAFEVTELIRSRRYSEASEENLRIALQAGKMGIWHLNLLNQTFHRSLQHDQIFGYDQMLPSWSYEQFLEHIEPEDKAFVAAQFDIASKFGDLFFEARIKTVNDQLRWIAVKGETFFEQQKPVRMAGVVMDITARKLVEEKLKELTEELAGSNAELTRANAEIQKHMQELSSAVQQLKLTNADLDNFIYTASHDLKTPISNIEGLLKLLLKGIPAESLEKEAIQKPVRLMEASINRFKTTIIELTDIAKVQKEAENTGLISMPALIEEVVLDMQTLLQEEQVVLEQKIIGTPKLYFSQRNLKSIVYNLLSNSIKYRHPSRTPVITISCYQEDGHPVLTVQDNGLGIEKKDLPKVFSMYTRLHTHVEGTGIGLYLVKRIVDNAQATLEVESQKNVGSLFKITFPAL